MTDGTTPDGGHLSLLLLSHVPDDPDGGASRVYHLLASSLRERGHAVELHHADAMGLPSDPRLRLLAKRVALPRYVSRHGRRSGPWFHDVVMSSSGMAAPLFRHLRRSAQRPVLVNHVHGLTVYDHMAALDESLLGHSRSGLLNRVVTGPFQARWDVAGVDTADLTVVQNARDLSEVAARTGGERVALVPAAVHPGLLEMSRRCPAPEDRRADTVVWFGTWEPRKGAWYVPGAFRRLRAAHPGATLTVGGTGRSEEEIRGHFEPQDRPHVRVLARVPIAEQVRELGAASVVLFPSLSEGFGLALVEAMCCGAAAVTTSTAFGGDHLRDGVTARVVPPTAEHLGRALVDLVGDDDTRRRIATAGRGLARSFTAERQAAAYEELLLARVPQPVTERSPADA